MSVPLFMQDDAVASILTETADCVPDGCDAYLVGGTMRNAMYYELHGDELPQRDYDLVFIGDGRDTFADCLLDNGFTYGKIRREYQTTFRKAKVEGPDDIDDFVVLDVHYHRDDVEEVVKEKINFTVNTFTINLDDKDEDWMDSLFYVDGAVEDMQQQRLRLNRYKDELHGSDLFACIRFVSLGFTAPPPEDVERLLDAYPKLPEHKFDRNVQKVFDYVGGEERARAILEELGIDEDIFSMSTLSKMR